MRRGARAVGSQSNKLPPYLGNEGCALFLILGANEIGDMVPKN